MKIEGHLCSTWDKGQYRRTRDIGEVVSAYEDFLTRMKLDYVDIGMIHYIDDEKDYNEILANAPRSSFRGHCMYCGHCAPCSKNIDIASVNKYLDLALIQETLPETLKNHYDLLKHQANECMECGICIKNCPFGVDIIKKMKQAVELFGN